MDENRRLQEWMLEALRRGIEPTGMRGGRVSLAKILLKQGRWFFDRLNSDQNPVTREWRRAHPPDEKQRFGSAQRFCCDHEDAQYFEGCTGDGEDGPFEHAWALLPQGDLVDFIGEARVRKARRADDWNAPSARSVYLGMPIPTSFFRQNIAGGARSEPQVRRYLFESGTVKDRYFM
jgi:hypothetical protein